MSGRHAYVTSGDTGGLSIYNKDTLAFEKYVPLDDARWVDVEGDRVVVVQGTPGRISILDDASLEVLATLRFNGADIAESKSTAEVIGGKVLIAAGTSGVQMLSIASGKVIGTVPLPSVPNLNS